MTYSPNEVLQDKDFEQMSLKELAEAKDLLKQCNVMFDEVNTPPIPAAHTRPASGHAEATLRAISRSGGRMIPLVRKQVRKRHPPLVLICDISGSMGRYSRLFLHFAHAVTSARDRVSTFRLRHAPDEYQLLPASPRCGSRSRAGVRTCAGLGRRHTDRRLHAGIQPRVVTQSAGSGRGCSVSERRVWSGSTWMTCRGR